MPLMKRGSIWGVLLIVLSLGLLATAVALAAAGDISTVAGTGTTGLGQGGFSGDGGPATGAQLNDPFGVAFDSSGNLFIADATNHRIRKVDTSGNISTVAGTGGGQEQEREGSRATAARPPAAS